MSEKKWSIYCTGGFASEPRTYFFESFYETEKALEDWSTLSFPGERFEVRELIDGEWVAQLVGVCSFTVMTPEEAEGE